MSNKTHRIMRILLPVSIISTMAFGQTELFMSEYIEGSSNNKAIEIFNPSEAPVSLSGYALRIYSNGNSTPSSTINLSGVINTQRTFVVTHSSANAAILATAQLTTGSLSFNGDDAVALVNNGTLIDCIGRIGQDPGTEWGSGDITTLNHTLRRKASITAGDAVSSDDFNPSVEWVGYPSDNSEGLGQHVVDQLPPTPPPSSAPLTILHVNDMHGRLTPHMFDFPDTNDIPVFERAGGAAYLTTRMLELKADHPDALILDGGDISEGNPLGDLRGNGAMVDFMNLLNARLRSLGGRGIDAAVVGNHDVRDVAYLNNIADADFPFISINVCREGTQVPYFQPWVIVTVGGMKVGIFGYTNDASSYLGSTSEPVIDVLKCVWFDTDPATINIRDVVQNLRNNEGCSRVIMLTHMGHSRICSGDDALLRDDGVVALPEVAVTGHWHSWTASAWQPGTLNNKTVLDEAASYMQYIGQLDIDSAGHFTSACKFPIRADSITPDSQVAAFITSLEAEYLATSPMHNLYDTIGWSAVDLRLDKDKWWTSNEYPWNGDNTAGAWVCDAMAWKAAALGYACDLAIQSGGGVRKDIPAGPVTYLDIYETYPWQDDNMVIVSMSGAQIRDYLTEKNCGASISRGWRVEAEDGRITGLFYNNAAVDTAMQYTVAVSQYMFDHYNDTESWPGTQIGSTTQSIRASLIEYTAQFTSITPMLVPQGRYVLDTEMAGIFDAVVTMIGDNENEPYFENAFIRLVRASPQTVARRGTHVPASLVNADGTINRSHQMCESMWYRSYLGFKNNTLRPGDIVRIGLEGGFYRFNPQFIEEDGVAAPDSDIAIVGRDTSLALPCFMSDIASFWDEFHENHYVKFYAVKTGPNRVRDYRGVEITVYEVGGYYTATLPGSEGDLLAISGVQTGYDQGRRFRMGRVSFAAAEGITQWPPMSHVNHITASPAEGRLTLTATAEDVPLNGQMVSIGSGLDAQVVSGSPSSNYGASTSIYLQKSGGSYGEEMAYLWFDFSALPADAEITGASVKMYCWKTSGAPIRAAGYQVTDDGWTESGITWSNRPAVGAAVDTASLAAINTWYSWDVTAFATAELAGDKQLSLAIAALDDGGAFTFDSREYQSGTLTPYLEITTRTANSEGEVASVTFYFRYSADNSVWTPWKPAGSSDMQVPWEQPFNCVNGSGYYQFYSVALDDQGAIEPAPLDADASFHFEGTLVAAEPVLRINGAAVDTEITAGLPVSVKASVLPNNWSGQPCEIWLYADAGGNRWWYSGGAWRTTGVAVPCRQGILSREEATVLSTSTLKPAVYTIHLIVDCEPDGVMNGVYAETVRVLSIVKYPTVSVSINGSVGPVSVTTTDMVNVALSLNPDSWNNQPGELWAYADAPGGIRYFYDPSVNGWRTGAGAEQPSLVQPLTVLKNQTIMRMPLEAGTYRFYFAVDRVVDGIPDNTLSASAIVEVQ